MKKLLCVILALLLLVGCSPIENSSSTYQTNTGDTYISGVWISYTELDGMLEDGDFKNQFTSAISNCLSRGITDVFVHVRAFCDSIYGSQYFPMRESVKQYDFDILEYMINICHQEGIKFHAWINPYRVRSTECEISALPSESPARRWLEDDDKSNDSNVAFCEGIYLNPASNEVRQLVIDGVREIISNYKVDGIHFDDYFYPTQAAEFDSESYNAYCDETQKPLSLADWRRANVNALISGCFTAIKFTDADIIFSISPAASLEDNYNKRYADIALWCDSGCIDYIIPQLYFGFEYPDDEFKFDNLISAWKSKIKNREVRLIIGLAAYKINTENEPDRDEWKNGTDVITRQTVICKETEGISGHIYFSYSAMCEYL